MLNIPSTIIRASGLAAIIFWAIIFTKEFSSDMFVFVLLSMIPISICCSLTICLTIAPFFWSKKESTSINSIYNKYFPYYAITVFIICFYYCLASQFETYVVAFFTAAFFTLLKSWIWIIEPEKTI